MRLEGNNKVSGLLISRFSLILLAAVIFSSALLFASCAPRVTKGSVGQEVSKGIRIGADQSDVVKYVDLLKVNGVKPTRYDYVRDTSGYPVTAPDGQKVEVKGIVSTSFSNGVGGLFSFCKTVGVIFYFDKFDKLITYHIDCFG